jgi:hypothetical protein
LDNIEGMKWRLPVLLAVLLTACISLLGENIRLYLKDGTFQLVKEYQVLQDRVKYLSAERDEWEEIPLDLIDLNRTKQEASAHQERVKQEEQEDAEENAAVREAKQEANSVPEDPGVYYVHGDKLETIARADIVVNHDTKRSVLKIISPIPVVNGKNTVDIAGAASKFRVEGDRPEFYFRLDAVEGFAMIKLTPKKNVRQVETVIVQAVTNELSEERDNVATFTKQSGDELFKIWPEKPLLPGEYALIQFSAEQGHLQVWDFGVGEPAAK